MAEIVNLRMARKAKARNESEAAAAANRAKFGASKSERKLRLAQAELAAKQLDGHKREPQDKA